MEFLYSKDKRPITGCPDRLALYLKEKWFKAAGVLIDVGCGRGDMLKALARTGNDVTGIDLSPASIDSCKPYPVKLVNLSTEQLPFEDGAIDYVFSKSVIEHMPDPLPLLKEVYRVLKPNGVAIIMTPSWVHNAWGPFYLDHTHVTPFTLPSLKNAMIIAGFNDVNVEHFYQLPFLWGNPWLKPFVKMVAKLPVKYRPMNDTLIPENLNTFIRFSNEVMLLAVAIKSDQP